jgi:hypothetical protein
VDCWSVKNSKESATVLTLVNNRFQNILKFLSDGVDSGVLGASPKPRDFFGMATVFNDGLLLVSP